MDSQIVAELQSIRLALYGVMAITAATFLLRQVEFILRMRADWRAGKEKAFRAVATEHLYKGAFRALAELCEWQLEQRRNDPSALWFLAQARFRMKEFAEARAVLGRLRDEAPEWRETHIAPLLRAIADDESSPT